MKSTTKLHIKLVIIPHLSELKQENHLESHAFQVVFTIILPI